MRARTGKRVGALCVLLAVLAGPPAYAATPIIYCDEQAPGAKDGSSWTDAYICLQNAIDSAATSGAEVRVAQGTYRPDRRMVSQGKQMVLRQTGNPEESFSLKNGVVIKGGYAGWGTPDPNARDIDAYPTILSGDLLGNDVELGDLTAPGMADTLKDPSFLDNSHSVVRAIDVNNSAVLDGFTITGGFTHADPHIPGVPAFTPAPMLGVDGAGAFISSASPTFLRCTFSRNIVETATREGRGGAGVAMLSSSPVFEQCAFVQNLAFGQSEGYPWGAGMLCGGLTAADPCESIVLVLTDCTFAENVAAGGWGSVPRAGALALFEGRAQLTRCSFVRNLARSGFAGAIQIEERATATFSDCTFEENAARLGGAVQNESTTQVTFVGCAFLRNKADNVQGGAIRDTSGRLNVVECRFEENTATEKGGALAFVYPADPCVPLSDSSKVLRCRFIGNVAGFYGGAIYNEGTSCLLDCLLSGNSASSGGACYSRRPGSLTLRNCTIWANQAVEQGGAVYGLAGGLREIRSCILWGDLPDEIHLGSTQASIQFNTIQGRSPVLGGVDNLNADPQFRDPLGADGIAGTADDDLRLLPGSPCIDMGDETGLDPATSGRTADLDGTPRVYGAYIDMGAYEFSGPFVLYVDAAGGNDSFAGNTPRKAFATIRQAINMAQDGYTIAVAPGLYREEIDFKGKAITVRGDNGAPTLEAPEGYGVSCYSAEGAGSILRNFVLRHCDVAIFLAGSAPTICNVTLSGNRFGIAAYTGADPTITSCILWGNDKGDLFGCKARYSCIEQPGSSEDPLAYDGDKADKGNISLDGNISADPLFADPENGDFHLRSEYGRFVPAYGLWTFDDKTSPGIDAGDPALDVSAERKPNGDRINMGAFGGTPQASLSKCPSPDSGEP